MRGAGLVACLDSLAASLAILTVLTSLHRPQTGGVEAYLSAPITVSSVIGLILLAPAWPSVFHLFGLYEVRRIQYFGPEARRLLVATGLGSVLALAFPVTAVTSQMNAAHLPHFWVVSLLFCLFVRLSRRAVERVRHRRVHRALMVGTGPLAQRACADIRQHRAGRFEIVGFLDEPVNGEVWRHSIPQEMIGTLDQLESLLMRDVIDEVVIALPVKSCYQQIQRVISVCERAGIQATYAADMFECTVALPRYHAGGDRAFVAMSVAPDGYLLILKRAVDVIGAAMGLLVLSPLLLVVAAAIKLTSQGPIVFSQVRCGLTRRPFRMFKFRSMYADAEKLQASLEDRNEASGPVFKIRDDPRITPLGRLLRRSSLDELPQLWNVLIGDMSLVGPRPLPWRDVQRINRPSDMRRFSMRPGITCLWQIQGRSNIGFERWVELDLEYIDSWSLGLDARILAQTLPAVWSGNGAT